MEPAASQVGTIITSVGTAMAAIITAILAGSRWLLKVWFDYQIKIQEQKKSDDQAFLKDLKNQLDVHAKTLGAHSLSLKEGAERFAIFNSKLEEQQKKLDFAIVSYKNNVESANRVIIAIKSYVQKTEEWKKDIDSKIIQLKNGAVMFKGKKP